MTAYRRGRVERAQEPIGCVIVWVILCVVGMVIIGLAFGGALDQLGKFAGD